MSQLYRSGDGPTADIWVSKNTWLSRTTKKSATPIPITLGLNAQICWVIPDILATINFLSDALGITFKQWVSSRKPWALHQKVGKLLSKWRAHK